MNQDPEIRRQDFRLRSEYVDIDAQIIKFEGNKYAIYIKTEDIRLVDLKTYFDHNIKFLTSPVELINKLPQEPFTVIPAINDYELALPPCCWI